MSIARTSALLAVLTMGALQNLGAGESPGIISPLRDLVKTNGGKWRMPWIASAAAHGAGTAFDAYASYHRGPYEANSLLADPDGQFGNKALGFKIVLFAGVTVLEYVLLRWANHHDSARAQTLTKTFTVVNLSGGAAYFASGCRNFSILRRFQSK